MLSANDKPIQQHNSIQTISRVNRKFEGKDKGLVVDYIGIKKQMNLALGKYNKGDKDNFEDIAQSLKVVRDHLDLLANNCFVEGRERTGGIAGKISPDWNKRDDIKSALKVGLI